jgi:hypothetical protein
VLHISFLEICVMQIFPFCNSEISKFKISKFQKCDFQKFVTFNSNGTPYTFSKFFLQENGIAKSLKIHKKKIFWGDQVAPDPSRLFFLSFFLFFTFAFTYTILFYLLFPFLLYYLLFLIILTP